MQSGLGDLFGYQGEGVPFYLASVLSGGGGSFLFVICAMLC